MWKNHDTAFKARVALEALKGEKAMAQLSSEYGVLANQIRQWRQKLLEELPSVFSDRRQKKVYYDFPNDYDTEKRETE